MTNSGREAAQELVSRLRRFNPAVNTRLDHLGGGENSVDFRLGFPDGPIAPIPEGRRGHTGNSGVIIGTEPYIGSFTLRLPPVQAGWYENHELEEVVIGAIEETQFEPKSFGVRIQPGVWASDTAKSWWPHVESSPGSRGQMDVDEFLRFLRELYQAYKEEVKG